MIGWLDKDGAGLIWLRTATNCGFSEQGDESSGSIKRVNVLSSRGTISFSRTLF